jgi:hypothetical protein
MDNGDMQDAMVAVTNRSFAQLRIELCVKPRTEAGRHLECMPIAHQVHHVPGSVENGGAVFADLEVGFHAFAKFAADLPVHIFGDLAPNFDTTDFDDHFSAYHGLIF